MASVRSEELWGEKATESAPETVTARGTREGFMNEKKGYYCMYHGHSAHRMNVSCVVCKTSFVSRRTYHLAVFI